MRIVVIYDVIVLRLRLLFSRILIDYEKNENKTPSKIYTITVCTQNFQIAKPAHRVNDQLYADALNVKLILVKN